MQRITFVHPYLPSSLNLTFDTCIYNNFVGGKCKKSSTAEPDQFHRTKTLEKLLAVRA